MVCYAQSVGVGWKQDNNPSPSSLHKSLPTYPINSKSLSQSSAQNTLPPPQMLYTSSNTCSGMPLQKIRSSEQITNHLYAPTPYPNTNHPYISHSSTNPPNVAPTAQVLSRPFFLVHKFPSQSKIQYQKLTLEQTLSPCPPYPTQIFHTSFTVQNIHISILTTLSVTQCIHSQVKVSPFSQAPSLLV